MSNLISEEFSLQLHLDLHSLGILESCLNEHLCPELKELVEYKFNELKTQYPQPADRPRQPKSIGSDGPGKRVYEENAWKNYHDDLKNWHLIPIKKRLRKLDKIISKNEKIIRNQGDNSILLAEMKYAKLLSETIENWCFGEYGHLPMKQSGKKGIRNIDKYSHLKEHKKLFPDLANELIKMGLLEQSRIYPEENIPNDMEEAIYLLNSFEHVVYHHPNHAPGFRISSVKQIPSDDSGVPQDFLVYTQK